MSFSTPIFDRPIPLTFDRVADDVPITSNTLLFRFPLELVSQIVSHLSPPDVASLAVVDTDCRQLARSVQYSRVSLELGADRTKGGWELLEALEGEKEVPRKTRPRSDSVLTNTTTRPRRIGPCIRHLRVTQKRPLPRHATSGADTLEVNVANDLSSRVAALCSPTSGVLPHLVTVDWDVPFHIDTFHLLSPKTRHLRINLSKFEPTNFDALHDCPSDTESALALETLVIDMDDASVTRPEVMQVALTLLHSAANTLRSLVWRNLDQRITVFSDVAMACILSLPKLQQLHLEGFSFPTPEPSSLAIPILPLPELKDLTLEGCTASLYDYLSLLGPLPGLRSLRLAPHPHLNSSFASRYVMGPEDLGSLCKFFVNNTHIQALDMSQSIPSTPLPHPSSLHSVVATISAFSDLRMLKLVFDAPPTDEVLSLVGGLERLEVLWLTAGNQGGYSGWRSEWEVDHERVVDALSRPSSSRSASTGYGAASTYVDLSTLPTASPSTSKSANPLPSLRTLIFTRDTYTTTPTNAPHHPLEDPRRRAMEARMYYREKRLPPGVCAEDWLSGEECLDLLSGSQPGSPSGSGSVTPNGVLPPSAGLGEGGLDVGIPGGSVGVAGGFDYDANQRMWRDLEGVAWERWHAERMGSVARGYFEKFGGLGDVYAGMVPVMRGKGGGGERDVDGAWVWGAWRSALRGL